MFDIGISEIAVTAKYEDTEQRSIKYDPEAAVKPSIIMSIRITAS